MPYCKSTSYNSFLNWYNEACKAIRLSAAKKYQNSRVCDHMLCSALFVSFARFENFIKDRLQEFVHQVNALQLKVNGLPSGLAFSHIRCESVNDHLRNYYITKNEGQLIEKLPKLISENSFCYLNPEYIPSINHSYVLKDVAYPEPGNIKILFKRVGIDNVFCRLNRILKGNAELALQSINDLRCEIGHVGMPPSLNQNDFLEKVKTLKAICRGLDMILQRHFTQIRNST